ncbi:hypothetical protein [Acetobacter papayae]|uniref:hypothetical protein n=1 Tax=Acetobacter papayae TaxID=1076592 RepID=UPI0009DF6555|nr:hypothetical protein [Acetobacter papayae]
MLRIFPCGYEGLTALLVAEQRRLVLWVPVGLALGAALYFYGLTAEPRALWGVWAPCCLRLWPWGLGWSGGMFCPCAAWRGFVRRWRLAGQWAGLRHTGSPLCRNSHAGRWCFRA